MNDQEIYELANRFLSCPVHSHEALFIANELADKTGRTAFRAGYWTARNLAEGIVRKHETAVRNEIGNTLAEQQIREETGDTEGWISGSCGSRKQPESVGDGMYCWYNEADETYDVDQKIKGRFHPRGFVYEDMDGTWSASRHTYTGVPADNGDGYASRNEAVLSLKDASPFRDERKRQAERFEVAQRIRRNNNR